MRILFISLYFILFTNIASKKEKSLKPIDEVQTTPLLESIKRGKEVYTDMCVTCHLPSGKGVANVFPPLAKSDYLMNKRTESIRAIKYGLQGEITVNGATYNQIMSPLGLENDEVADVMNYITNSWGNENLKMTTVKEVEAVTKK
jgi:mono/diheme cytochrome c family protein